MKVLSIPSSGRMGQVVAYVGRFGQCQRTYTPPTNRRTEAQQHMREVFGGYSQMWGRRLTEQQRDRWNAEGAEVWSHPRCGTRGKLAGEQFFTGINSVLGCVGLPPLWEPPARVVFGLSPVRDLVITNDEGGVRLFLRLAAAAKEDIMVFGQASCSAGRSRRRNVSYLGLLPAPDDGLSEITELYRAKFGEPRAGTKVFIVSCQQKNGWKGMEQVTCEIVPGLPAEHAKQAKEELNGLSGLKELTGAEGVMGGERTDGLKPLMYKGCTRDVQGTAKPEERRPEGGVEAGSRGAKPTGTAIGSGEEASEGRIPPVGGEPGGGEEGV